MPKIRLTPAQVAAFNVTEYPQTQEYPAMPFYPAEWISGNAVQSMTAEVEGYFIHLLAQSWLQQPPCSLPSNEHLLSGLARCDPRIWRRVKAQLLSQFVKCSDGRLRNAKQVSVWLNLMSRSKIRRSAAESRWSRADASGDDLHMQKRETDDATDQRLHDSQSCKDDANEPREHTLSVLVSVPVSEKKEKTSSSPKKLPDDFVVPDDVRFAIKAETPGLDIDREHRKFIDWTPGKRKVDWIATWRNWMRRAWEEGITKGRIKRPSSQPQEPKFVA